MISSIRLIACGSKLPAPETLGEHQADVGLERAAVAALVATGQAVAGAGEHDGVVELEPDRHLLQRLEDRPG